MKLFTIRDVKSEGFNPPFNAATFGLAERNFKEAANDPQSMIAKHKEDFSLFHVGDFDPASGQIIPCEPKFVCNAM